MHLFLGVGGLYTYEKVLQPQVYVIYRNEIRLTLLGSGFSNLIYTSTDLKKR